MGNLIAQERSIVVPGELLAHGMDYIPSEGTYRLKEDVYAQKIGLLHIEGRVLKIVALSGVYIPRRGDTIIAKVTDVSINGWVVDTNSAYRAMLSMKEGTTDFIKKGSDLTRYYNVGDYLLAKIINVTPQFLVDITMIGRGLSKLSEGRVIKVNPYKVPRIIGKQGSMVSMIKQATDCRITVGQNGLVWVKGDPEMEILAITTIRMIVEKAHIKGLTDMIKEFLEKATKKTIDASRMDTEEKGEDHV